MIPLPVLRLSRLSPIRPEPRTTEEQQVGDPFCPRLVVSDHRLTVADALVSAKQKRLVGRRLAK